MANKGGASPVPAAGVGLSCFASNRWRVSPLTGSIHAPDGALTLPRPAGAARYRANVERPTFASESGDSVGRFVRRVRGPRTHAPAQQIAKFGP
jgi:hypothetical protein